MPRVIHLCAAAEAGEMDEYGVMDRLIGHRLFCRECTNPGEVYTPQAGGVKREFTDMSESGK